MSEETKSPEELREEKVKAAAEARAARAAARAQAKAAAESDGQAESGGQEEAPKQSPNQPLLDRLVEIIKTEVGEEAIAEAFINEKDDHLPCLVVPAEYLLETMRVMKHHPELRLNYLRNVAGTDRETHMEVIYHLISLDSVREYGVKVKTDRNQPSIPSVVSLYETANWQEREIYDLLGIQFPGHPDLRRILLPDDWVGHPLRKDYEPLDPEV